MGEKSRHGAPNAYIYQYPSLNIEQTLEHGTERAYSAAAFNSAGDRLATVGSYPDFMLTVWDWESGCTLLRSKAFSQEVYCVSFCPYSEGALVTSGTGSTFELLVVICDVVNCALLLQEIRCRNLILTQQFCSDCMAEVQHLQCWCALFAVCCADTLHVGESHS